MDCAMKVYWIVEAVMFFYYYDISDMWFIENKIAQTKAILIFHLEIIKSEEEGKSLSTRQGREGGERIHMVNQNKYRQLRISIRSSEGK